MRRVLFAAFAALAFITSCTKSDICTTPLLEVSEEVTASLETTRTSLEGTTVVWHKNDMLSIFTKTAHNRKYKVKSISEDGRTATFGYVSYTGVDDTKISSNYAVYPYDSEATISNGVITTRYNSVQQYNYTSGDLGYALMAAKSQDNNFSFKNAGSLIRFTIKTNLPDTFHLQSIALCSAENMIAGEVTIDLNNDDYKAQVTENGTYDVSLTNINTEIDSQAKSFHIAMPATLFGNNDLTVTFTFDEGDKVFTLPAFELKHNSIKTIAYTISDAEDFIGHTPSVDDEPTVEDWSDRTPKNNEIWYTATEKIEADSQHEWTFDTFGATIVSHEWNPTIGVGIIACDSDVTTISNGAFHHCGHITSIIIPETVTLIRNAPFENCWNLERVYISNLDMWYNMEFGVKEDSPLLNITDLYIDNELFTDWVIPSDMTTVTNRFLGCSSLNNVVFHSNITAIEDSAFYLCKNIDNVYVDSLEQWYNIERPNDTANPLAHHANLYIGGELFTEWYVPENHPDIRWYFAGCDSLQKVVMHDGVNIVGTDALFGCHNLRELNLGNSITQIDDWAFCDCLSLVEVTIPDSVVGIRCCAFRGCLALESVTIGDGTTEIADGAFESCTSMSVLNLGSSVEIIGHNVFLSSNISEVVIPESIESIGCRAFCNCANLSAVYCKATTPPTANYSDQGFWKAFDNNAAERVIYVPAEAIEAYRTAEGWSSYADVFVGYDFINNKVVE